MSRAPDLSVFPIPRKGGARPIIDAETEPAPPLLPPPPLPEPPQAAPRPNPPGSARPARPAPRPAPTPEPVRGPVIATTVKLDESRYLRLMEAGAPRPGRLRRRTIQDMFIEALDEWLERRDL
jgi:hypothetical protein